MEKLNLEEIRQEIDGIDARIGELLEARWNVVNKVAAYKEEHSLPLRDKEREAKVVEKAAQRAHNPAYADSLRRVMSEVIEVTVGEEEKMLAALPSVRAEQNLTVGYQGVPGAYGHLAAETYFAGSGAHISNFLLFEEVAQAVSKGEISYGVLPIENSSTGGISEVYDLIRRYGCYIVGEQLVKVEHNLLAWPGTRIEDVTEVYSHPQGFAQCRPFFRQYPQMKQIPYFNTAKGAELVAEQKQNYMAAVAGKQAATRYGLEILAANINHNSNNYTRFFVIARSPLANKMADKITLVATLRHEPGALYHLLGDFEVFGLNLLNIESRPIEGKSWEYFFHIDVRGNLEDDKVQKALARVAQDAAEYKILGNYIGAKA